MYVIRLPNGNLLVPEPATARDGQLAGDAYVEVTPSDPDFQRLAEGALSQEEFDERKRRWREGDEPLRRQMLEFLARGGELDEETAVDSGSPRPSS